MDTAVATMKTNINTDTNTNVDANTHTMKTNMGTNTNVDANTHTMKTNMGTYGDGVCPVTTDDMLDDMLMDFDMPDDVMDALNSINDSDVTTARGLSTGSDFPSPSTFCPSPATMMGMALSVEMNAEFDMPAVVPDADTAPSVPSAFDVNVNEVSVEDLAAIFARDTTGQVMQLAKVLCKAPVKINEKPALKKKRAAKVSVPESKKDAKYYARRAKNTAAAKRNRDLKKQKRVLEKEQANAKAAIMTLFSAAS